jgi:hypothetical protein
VTTEGAGRRYLTLLTKDIAMAGNATSVRRLILLVAL